MRSGEAEAERQRAVKGKAPAPASPQHEEPTSLELVTLEELSECMSSETGPSMSVDAYLAQQIAAYERCQQQRRESQAAADVAQSGGQDRGQAQQAQQGQGQVRRIAAALSMFAGAPTLEEAVEAMIAPSAAPSAAAAGASAPGAQGGSSCVSDPQLSSTSYASSASGGEMELASIGSSSGAGCSSDSSPACAGRSAGWHEVDLAAAPHSSCAGGAGTEVCDLPGPSGSHSRAAAWLHSQPGPAGGRYAEWDGAGPCSGLPALHSGVIACQRA